MIRIFLPTALLASCLGLVATGASADCESDLVQLEAAFKAPNLSPQAKTALEAAKAAAVAALKKDDDKACHKAVAEGLAKAGMTMQ